jgi:hypothetical protein
MTKLSKEAILLQLKLLAHRYEGQALQAESIAEENWPGDTQYDGGEEEADAAALEERADVYRDVAQDLRHLAERWKDAELMED